jgi:phosphatidylglycerol:prolipoprotein diacylglycerol transferase
MSLDKMVDVLIYGTVAAIIGARLYYVFSKWDYYSANPEEIIRIWEGGLAIYGGIIGGIAAAFVVCNVRKLNFWNLLDIAGMSLLIGQGIGRWGNFTNQEAFGVNTDMPWGMWSPKVHDYIVYHQDEFAANGFTVDPDKFVHPTFLYESLWCLLGVLVLYIITTKARKFSGQTFLCYGIWYGLERTVVEGLRTDSLYIAGTLIRTSQALSMAIVAVCTVLLVVLLIKYKKNPKPIEGIDYFDKDVEEKRAAKEKKKAAEEV